MAASCCLKRLLRYNTVIVNRSIHNWVRPILQELYRRRQIIGPEPPKQRSSFIEWNYRAELFAFGQRLNENFTENSLRIAFTNPSYVAHEEKKRIDLGIPKDDVPLDVISNTELAEKGENLMSNYISRYLRYCFPFFPEEGIIATHDYLMSTEVLAHVGSNIGMWHLMLCEEFPPQDNTFAQAFKAVVGALIQDDSVKRAELFVQDLVLTQLVDKDVYAFWDFFNPMGVLTDILKREGRGLPEARLIREAGRKTILAVYVVAVYSDKKFLGMAPGETLDIAEEMAARECLRRMFRLTQDQRPLPFGKEGRLLQLTSEEPNLSIKEWSSQKVSELIQSRENITNPKVALKC